MRELFKNLFIRSTVPFAHGAATTTLRCFTFTLAMKSVNSRAVNAVPLSETNSIGFPKVLNTFKNSLV